MGDNEGADYGGLDLGATIRGFAPTQKLFQRYALQKILGRGGMGVVWLALDEKLGRMVALKFLPELLMRDPEAIGDLKRETNRSLELTHPNIVRIYDFIQDDFSAAISMEYVDGGTLSALKIAQPSRCLGVSQIAGYIGQLCQALDYAHVQARVVHRDLKPANLMLSSRGDLKITDFGIARSVSDSVSRVSIVSTRGTLIYMSPQQALGERASVLDDVYSLGATIYDLLTGKPPFHTGNIQRQLDAVVPPSMTERREALGNEGEPIPAAWEETVARCLEKEPGARPQSVGEVLAGLFAERPEEQAVVVKEPAPALEEAEAEAPVELQAEAPAAPEAQPQEVIEIAPARAGRRAWPAIAIALGAVLFLGLGGYLAVRLMSPRGTEQSDAARPGVDRLKVEKERQRLAEARSNAEAEHARRPVETVSASPSPSPAGTGTFSFPRKVLAEEIVRLSELPVMRTTASIALIDMNRIFSSYYKTKDAENRINEARSAAKQELDERMDTYKKDLDRINGLNAEIQNEQSGASMNRRRVAKGWCIDLPMGPGTVPQSTSPRGPLYYQARQGPGAGQWRIRQEAAAARNESLRAHIKERDDLIQETKNLEQEITEFRTTREKQIQQEAVQMRNGIVDEITSQVTELVQAHDAEIVLDISGQGLDGTPIAIYHRNIPDWSDVIISRLNNKGNGTPIPDAEAPGHPAMAVVDTARIYWSLPETKAADATLDAARAENREEMDAKTSAYNQLLAETNTLSGAEKNARIAEANAAQQAMNDFKTRSAAALQAQAKTARDGIVSDIEKAINTVASRGGCDLVLDWGGNSLNGVPVAVANAGVRDISDEVIDEITSSH